MYNPNVQYQWPGQVPGQQQPLPGATPQPGAAPMGGAAPGGQLPPELVQQILALQQQGGQQSQVQRQLALAKQMRADAGDQMRSTNAGGMHIPPTIFNAAANLFGKYKAGQLERDAGVREQNMGVQTQDAMRRYFDAMTGGAGARRVMGHMGDEGE